MNQGDRDILTIAALIVGVLALLLGIAFGLAQEETRGVTILALFLIGAVSAAFSWWNFASAQPREPKTQPDDEANPNDPESRSASADEGDRTVDTGRQTEDCFPELFPKDFGERLERLRELVGLPWEEFAERLGVDDGRVEEWRKGSIPSGGEVWHIMHLASTVPGGAEVMLTEATED